ncbi:hypothetical protein [Methanosarcina barkeri]|nr:hypothetical protein [Methanosarcina barkeri]
MRNVMWKRESVSIQNGKNSGTRCRDQYEENGCGIRYAPGIPYKRAA